MSVHGYTWQAALAEEKKKPYFQDILNYINREKELGKTIYPPSKDIFNAFRYTPLDRVRVVILGQDPYHGPGQAHGLAFSVRPGVRPPPSLQNIFKEINDDVGIPITSSGYLKPWADQGVFLLNAILTVERGKPQSHAGIGWEQFTDAVIRILSNSQERIIFLLWGSYAQKKGSIIDFTKHTILEAPHPSPLSAHRGFLGCRHFSQTNTILAEQGFSPINWSLEG